MSQKKIKKKNESFLTNYHYTYVLHILYMLYLVKQIMKLYCLEGLFYIRYIVIKTTIIGIFKKYNNQKFG